mgnify:FL=1
MCSCAKKSLFFGFALFGCLCVLILYAMVGIDLPHHMCVCLVYLSDREHYGDKVFSCICIGGWGGRHGLDAEWIGSHHNMDSGEL